MGLQYLRGSETVSWEFAMIPTLEVLESRHVFHHNVENFLPIVDVPLRKPLVTPQNLTSLILHCDVTILSITSEEKDVTAGHLEDLLRELHRVRHLTLKLCIPREKPYLHIGGRGWAHGYIDYDPPSYNNIADHLRGASSRLQSLIIDYGACLRADVLEAGEYLSQLEKYLSMAKPMTALHNFKSLERFMAPSQAFVSCKRPANNAKRLRCTRLPRTICTFEIVEPAFGIYSFLRHVNNGAATTGRFPNLKKVIMHHYSQTVECPHLASTFMLEVEVEQRVYLPSPASASSEGCVCGRK